MKDILGNKLKIGDKVVFSYKKKFEIGNITKFYKSRYNKDECTVGGITHIQSHRILKLEKKDEEVSLEICNNINRIRKQFLNKRRNEK